MEILKGGGNNPTKRAWRFAKKRLGTHIRAKRKVAEMDRVIGEVKKQESQAKAAAGTDRRQTHSEAQWETPTQWEPHNRQTGRAPAGHSRRASNLHLRISAARDRCR